jgi:hypothetical protein
LSADVFSCKKRWQRGHDSRTKNMKYRIQGHEPEYQGWFRIFSCR